MPSCPQAFSGPNSDIAFFILSMLIHESSCTSTRLVYGMTLSSLSNSHCGKCSCSKTFIVSLADVHIAPSGFSDGAMRTSASDMTSVRRIHI